MTRDTPEVTVETLQRLLEAFNAHDIEAVMAFFPDDCVLEMPRGVLEDRRALTLLERQPSGEWLLARDMWNMRP